MKKLKYVYIAGPMTGLPKKNFPAFTKAAKALRKVGFKIVNPAELENIKPVCHTWEDCLRRDLLYILKKCFAIATLPGWEKSKGALLETYVAEKLGMPIVSVEQLLRTIGTLVTFSK